MRPSLQEAAAEFVSRGHRAGLIRSALESDDGIEFHDADRAAGYLDLDTFDYHWARLNEKPGYSEHKYGTEYPRGMGQGELAY